MAPRKKKTETLPVAYKKKIERQTLEDLFPGNENHGVRQALILKGEYTDPKTRKTIHVQHRRIQGTEQYEVMAIAAVSRDPGRSEDYVATVADFLPQSNSNRANQVGQWWRIYEQEGIVNNAVNKIAATLSSGGRF